MQRSHQGNAMNKLIVIALVTGACALALAGCGESPREAAAEQAAEAAIEAQLGQEVDIEQDGEVMTIQTEEGEMRVVGGDAAELPEDFPDDVVLPDDYRLYSVMAMDGGSTMLNLSVPDDMLVNAGKIDQAMRAQGWAKNDNMSMTLAEDMRVVSYHKGQQRIANYTFHDDGDNGSKMTVQLISLP